MCSNQSGCKKWFSRPKIKPTNSTMKHKRVSALESLNYDVFVRLIPNLQTHSSILKVKFKGDCLDVLMKSRPDEV